MLHEFVIALSVAIPKTELLGDRLQAIFTFVGPMATQEGHVLPNLPAFKLEIELYRWRGHNTELGQWLLDNRSQLVPVQTFDHADHVCGLQFVPEAGPTALSRLARTDLRFCSALA